jgi:DNA topoisomerase VI subunit B
VGRKLGTHLRGQRKKADLARKHRYIERYLPHIGVGVRDILGLNEKQERQFVEQLQAILERSRT